MAPATTTTVTTKFSISFLFECMNEWTTYFHITFWIQTDIELAKTFCHLNTHLHTAAKHTLRKANGIFPPTFIFSNLSIQTSTPRPKTSRVPCKLPPTPLTPSPFMLPQLPRSATYPRKGISFCVLVFLPCIHSSLSLWWVVVHYIRRVNAMEYLANLSFFLFKILTLHRLTVSRYDRRISLTNCAGYYFRFD